MKEYTVQVESFKEYRVYEVTNDSKTLVGKFPTKSEAEFYAEIRNKFEIKKTK